MDVFSHSIKIKSRADVVNIYFLSDLHEGAPNFDEDRLKRTIRFIQNDKCQKIVILGGDLVDGIYLRDQKRFTPDNLSDDVLTGSPSQIRKNLSNLVTNQARKVVKHLEPIKEHILAAVFGNHELSILKSCGVDLHSIICESLGIRNSGDIGIVCVNIARFSQSKLFRIAYMHSASGGRTAGASNNSLARALNIFSCDVVFQGHNHSPAVQRIVTIGTTNPQGAQDPKIVRRDRVGVNNGAFTKSYQENVCSYDQQHLYNPKDEVIYRVSVKMIEEHTTKHTSATPRLSLTVEELHI